MNEINRWGFMNSLISIINDGATDDANITIALYLLENFNQLQDLNIYDVADECFVSRATVRRLAQSLGFENFKDLKKQFSGFSDKYYFSRSGIDSEPNGQSMAEQLYHMAQECERYLTPERRNEILNRLNSARQIVFLTSDMYSRQASEFQKAMILAGKMVRVVSNKYANNSVLTNMSDDDVLIVASISGFFAEQMLSTVQGVNGFKILATTVRDDKYKACYDQIWYLSERPQTQRRSVYTIYAIQYFLEEIFTEYIQKYGK